MMMGVAAEFMPFGGGTSSVARCLIFFAISTSALSLAASVSRLVSSMLSLVAPWIWLIHGSSSHRQGRTITGKVLRPPD
jgi:hypothetical protein